MNHAAGPIEPDLSKLDFSVVRFRQQHEAFTDPKMLGKRLSNEGHGFSRAVNGLRA